MNKFLFSSLFLLGSTFLYAQEPVRVTPDAKGQYSVIAFMVDFQPDLDSLTFRNGKFHLAVRDTGFLDSYPHDAGYFSNHLTFLKNYWESVSKNSVQVDTKLIQTVLTLPNVMSYYSSYKQNSDTAYSRLIRDFTSELKKNPGLISEIQSNYISEDRTHFILFHAGLGHDINWVSVFGYDPTPKDISSIFLGESFMKRNFGGNPELTGGINLTHLSILPETLTRPYEAFGKKTYLNFGINGLMVANMGNFFGLPDLYNSRNGNSAIGRFGLMDGYGFFNYNGHIPSAPSVWEKYQLGWVKPRILNPADLPQQIKINSDHSQPNFDSSAVFIYLGSNRYYLLENKLRENPAGKEGVTVSYSDNGNLTKSFTKDEDSFYYYDQSAIKGVITNVSNFDWTFPAGINEKNDTIPGGVVIWRLNDEVVSTKLATDSLGSLNADIKNPALKVIEADGSYDIGRLYGSLEGASGSEVGTIFDYFYQGNIAPLYKNKIDSDTRPSSDWDYRVPTFLTISGFGRPAISQKLSVAYNTSNQIPETNFSSITVSHEITSADHFVFNSNDYAFIFSEDSLKVFINGLFAYGQKSGVLKTAEKRNYAVESKTDSLLMMYVKSAANNGEYDQVGLLTILSNGTILTAETPVSTFTLLDDIQVVRGGFVRLYRLKSDAATQIRMDVMDSGGNSVRSQVSTIPELAAENFQLTIIPDRHLHHTRLAVLIPSVDKFYILDGSTVYENDGRFSELYVQDDGLDSKLLGYSSGSFSVLNSANGALIKTVPAPNKEPETIAAADDMFYSFHGQELFLNGFENNRQIDNFPIQNPAVTSDIKLITDNEKDYIIYRTNSNWFIQSVFGEINPHYLPLSGSVSHFNFDDESGYLTGVSIQNKNRVDVVKLKAKPVWVGRQSASAYLNRHIGVMTEAKIKYTQVNNPNKSDAYVWPNPIKEGFGFFRLNLPFNGSGEIIIHDLTGQVVTEISVSVQKNQETEFAWTIGSAQSGLYLATVDISGDGHSFSKIIKVLITR